jgi:hypothetical protein
MSKEDAIEVEASSGREPAAEILSEAKDLRVTNLRSQ